MFSKIKFGSVLSSKEINKIIKEIDNKIDNLTITNFNGFLLNEPNDNNIVYIFDGPNNIWKTKKIYHKIISKGFQLNGNQIIGFPQNNENIILYDSSNGYFVFEHIDFNSWRNHSKIVNQDLNLEGIRNNNILVYKDNKFVPRNYIYNNFDNGERLVSNVAIESRLEEYYDKYKDLKRSIEQIESKFEEVLKDLPMYLEFDPFKFIEPPRPDFKVANIQGDFIKEAETGTIEIKIKNEGNLEYTKNVLVEIPAINYSEITPIELKPEGVEGDEDSFTLNVSTDYGDHGLHDIEVQVQNDEKVAREAFEVEKVPEADFTVRNLNDERIERG